MAGGIASLIAYRQWKTAKEKVILDLFAKRLEVYNTVNDAVIDIILEGIRNSDSDPIKRLEEGFKASKFLFGSEIVLRLNSVRSAAKVLLRNERSEMQTEKKTDNPEIDEQNKRMLSELLDFYGDIDRIFAPYMLMDARLSRTIFKLSRRDMARIPDRLGDWLVKALIKQRS